MPINTQIKSIIQRITKPPENNNTNDKIIADNRSKENKRFEYAKQKCLKSERKLIFAAYTNKKDCLEIDNLLECHFVDGVNRDILVELVLYYQQNNLMLDEIFFNKLTEEQKNTLQSILANETLPGSSEIKILVKNVKEWPFKNAINRINKEIGRCKSKDTIKIADSSGVIKSTTQRANTWIIQTPQTFDRLTLLKAHESFKNDDSITDDCMVLEKYGEPVKIIPGDYTNIKLTTYEEEDIVKWTENYGYSMDVIEIDAASNRGVGDTQAILEKIR